MWRIRLLGIIMVTWEAAFASPLLALGQTYYHDVQGSVIQLTDLEDWAVVQLDTASGKCVAADLRLLHDCLDDTLPPIELTRGFTQFALKDGCTFDSVRAELVADPQVSRVFRAYADVFGRGAAAVTDLIYIRFQRELSLDSCLAILGGFELRFEDSIPPGFSLMMASIPDTESVGPFDYANAVGSLPQVNWAAPVFCSDPRLGSLPTDEFFQYQYYFYNVGQFGGTPGVDICADSAWMVHLTDSAVTVALIDDGLEPHPDLPLERLLSDSDFVGANYGDLNPDGDATPGISRFHGMACAGIIAASHDEIGVAGLHGGCKIVAAKIAADDGIIPKAPLGDIAIRNAILYADSMAADVISCSWEMGNQVSGIVQDAILEAMDCEGNDESAAIFVFMAGNRADGNGADPAEPWIRFPNNMPGVVTVGAVNNDGYRWGYSCFGPELEVMAPSGDDNEFYWKPDNQYTLDRAGANGWNPAPVGEWEDPCVNVDYTGRMGGTSGAAPQVAGIVALLLSKKPELADIYGLGCDPMWPARAREIICSSAIDIYIPGYDEATGFGIANAFRALLSVSRGDFNNDGAIDVLDVVRCVNIAFRGGAVADNAWHPAVQDPKCDGVCSVADVVALVNVAFRGQSPEPPCYIFDY